MPRNYDINFDIITEFKLTDWVDLTRQQPVGNKVTSLRIRVSDFIQSLIDNGLGGGGGLWAPGTGTEAIIAINTTNPNTAVGQRAVSFGLGNQAAGDFSLCVGNSNQAIGFTSFATGGSTRAIGDFSVTFGQNTEAQASFSLAQGNGAQALGEGSTALGQSTEAGGNYSFSQGYQTLASGLHSFAQGDNTTASGENSHSQGQETTASGRWSHASGFKTIASGDMAISSGFGHPVDNASNVVAGGFCSFAHFRQTNATGSIGALADYSAILGGTDHNIPSGFTNSVILGGSNINASASDTVYVPRLEVAYDDSEIVLRDAGGARYSIKVVGGALQVNLIP